VLQATLIPVRPEGESDVEVPDVRRLFESDPFLLARDAAAEFQGGEDEVGLRNRGRYQP
jgi:hypothetical protein